jgi:ABC-type multidrug transport system fused ATPase/permease subunit
MEQQNSKYVRQYAIYNGLRMGFLFLSTSSTLLYVIYRGTVYIRSHQMTGGQLTTFSTYAFLFGLGTTGILKSYNEMNQVGRSSAQRYYQLMQLQQQQQQQPDIVHPPNGSAPEQPTAVIPLEDMNAVTSIVVQNVSFSYDDANEVTATTADEPDNHFVLRDISLIIPRGKVIALVGHNGAGKSTLVNLLAGLYTPTHGTIDVVVSNRGSNNHVTTADNDDKNNNDHTDPNQTVTTTQYNIRNELDRTTQNKLLQVISQTTSLFDMSIYENVRYSCPAATVQDVENALDAANGTSMVQGKPAGIHSRIGRNGGLLSGGECQKIALARALVVDPMILVLDEPATSLDTEGTNALHEAILQQRQQQQPRDPSIHQDTDPAMSNDNQHHSDFESTSRGILIITHEAKTILDLQVDYIYVLQNGRIVEEGDVDALRSNAHSELCSLMPSLYKQP